MPFRNWTLRKYVLSAVAVSLTAIFISLGFWQLRRLDARRDANARLAARRIAPEVELDSLPRDTAQAHYRRVHVRGAYDHPQEIIFTLRQAEGLILDTTYTSKVALALKELVTGGALARQKTLYWHTFNSAPLA